MILQGKLWGIAVGHYLMTCRLNKSCGAIVIGNQGMPRFSATNPLANLKRA
jgi:hypothetical protein